MTKPLSKSMSAQQKRRAAMPQKEILEGLKSAVEQNDAIEALLLQHAPGVRAILHHRWPIEPEDIDQIVMIDAPLKLIHNVHRIDLARGTLRSLYLCISDREACSLLRQIRKSIIRYDSPALETLQERLVSDDYVEQFVGRNKRINRVRQFRAKCPKEMRKIVDGIMEGKSIAVIAEEVKKTRNNVAVQVNKIKHRGLEDPNLSDLLKD